MTNETTAAVALTCDYEGCTELAQMTIGVTALCTDPDHIEWGVGHALAPAGSVRDAIRRHLVDRAREEAAEEAEAVARVQRNALIRHYIGSASTALRAAQRAADGVLAESLAAVALQAEDLLEYAQLQYEPPIRSDLREDAS